MDFTLDCFIAWIIIGFPIGVSLLKNPGHSYKHLAVVLVGGPVVWFGVSCYTGWFLLNKTEEYFCKWLKLSEDPTKQSLDYMLGVHDCRELGIPTRVREFCDRPQDLEYFKGFDAEYAKRELNLIKEATYDQ